MDVRVNVISFLSSFAGQTLLGVSLGLLVGVWTPQLISTGGFV